MSVELVADLGIPEGDCDCDGNMLDECGSLVAGQVSQQAIVTATEIN